MASHLRENWRMILDGEADNETSVATKNCDNCLNRDVTTKAIRWCPNCEEALCKTCLEHHNASRLAKSHETVALVDNNKLPDFISDLKTYCSEHDEKFELFCMRHQECCCPSCVKEKHRECSIYETIKDVVKGVKSSPAFEDIELELENVIKNFDSIKENRIANKENVLEKKKAKVSEIRQMREKLNKHLDEIEEAFIKEVSDEVDGIVLCLDLVVQNVSEKKVFAEELKRQFARIKEFATEIQAFMSIKTLEGHVSDDLSFQRSVLKESSASEHDFEVEFEDFLKSLSDKIIKFGSVKATKSASTVELATRKLEQAQKPIPVPASLTSKLKENTRTSKQWDIVPVSGSPVMGTANSGCSMS